ncbi:MAG: cadherin-like domain-containing protein, partial [Phycisphaerales bacterium]|nr:cadherin-like domain-containing protein [Phycisphaerales bacterium]
SMAIPGGSRLRISGAGVGKATATFRAEALEQRILMSATWVDADTGDALDHATEGHDIGHGGEGADILEGLGGHDVLHGHGGDDQLFGGLGDDTLHGGAGDDLLHGGEGHDTADYSDATGGVAVDLTTGHTTGADGHDTLVSIEGVHGSNHDDVFSFEAPAPGATYTIDGGGGSNTIDLSHFDLNDATFDNGALHIHTDSGDFTINYDHIDSIQFGDETASVIHADTTFDDFSGSHVFVDGDQAFRLNMQGGHADWSYDADTDTLNITDIDGTTGDSTLSIEDLHNDDLHIGSVTLDADLGSFTSNVDLDTLSIAHTANVGHISIDDGQGTIDTLQYTGGSVATQPVEIDANINTLAAQELGANVTINGDVGHIDILDDITIDSHLTVNGDVGVFHLGDDIWNDADVTINGDVDHVQIDGDIAAGSTLNVAGHVNDISVNHIAGDVHIHGDVDSINASDISGTLHISAASGTINIVDGDHTFSNDFSEPHAVTYDGATKTINWNDQAPLVDAGVDMAFEPMWFDDTLAGDHSATFDDLAGSFTDFVGNAEQTLTFSEMGVKEKLGDQYLDSHGVSFENTAGGQYNAYSGANVEGGAIVEDLTGYDGSYDADGDNVYLKFSNNDPDHPFTINFDEPVASVGAMLAVGKEGPVHSVKVTLYDADGVKIGEHIVEPQLWDATTSKQNYESFFGIHLDEARISKVEILNLSQTNFSDALVIDNLSWSHEPTPPSDATVNEGDTVTLKGIANDSDSPNLTYEWKQTGGPTVELDDPHALNPSFTAPADAGGSDITFELHVSDGTTTSVDSVLVHVNAAPTAEAGSVTGDEDTAIVVQLGATDAESDVAAFRIDTLPEHGVLKLNGEAVSAGTEITPQQIADGDLTFEPDADFNGDAQFSFSASDGEVWSHDSASFTVHVDPVNDAPDADAGVDQVVQENDIVTLDATHSSDVDGDNLTFTWRQTDGPAVDLSDPHASQPTFSAPDTRHPTTLRFEVEVSDGETTRIDVVEIEVHDPEYDWVRTLNYTQFKQLDGDQADYLSPDQIATIPNSSWFATMSTEARESLDADQVQALDVANVSIGYLTPDQREMLTPDQVDDLGYTQFR